MNYESATADRVKSQSSRPIVPMEVGKGFEHTSTTASDQGYRRYLNSDDDISLWVIPSLRRGRECFNWMEGVLRLDLNELFARRTEFYIQPRRDLLSNGTFTETPFVRLFFFDQSVGSGLGEPHGKNSTSQKDVPALLNNIRKLSGLTLEMVAPLLGVSRRSLQSWRAGKSISLRKEERLRHLESALIRISVSNPGKIRIKLLERVPGRPRLYDLLAEGRFELAVERATQIHAPLPVATSGMTSSPNPPLDAQIAITGIGLTKPLGKLNRNGSRRLKK